MSRKPISSSVIKKLFLKSGNRCCFPDCSELLYDEPNDTILAEICHIYAVNPKGARYLPSFPSEQINEQNNLLLMCPKHHKIIDRNPEKYPALHLIKFKKEHEENYSKLFDKSSATNFNNKVPSKFAINNIKNEFLKIESDKEPEAKNYPKVPSYIKRKLKAVFQDKKSISLSNSIEDIIQENKRITILGVAGSGKSIELDQIAYNAKEWGYYPIKIRLNYITNQEIEDILIIEYSEFKKAQENKILVIMDSLDEVHSDYIDIVSNKIISFSKKYSNSTIIVSCRNNFYTTENEQGGAKLDDFRTFVLEPLSYGDIAEYLKMKSIYSVDFFIKKVKEHKLFDLLFSPFYLVNLVDFYVSQSKFPNTKKDIFEYFINKRIQDDQNKYKNSGVNIRDFQLKVENELEKLAIVAECMSRNYLLEKDELQRIVTDDKLFKVLKHTFLFNKDNTHKWEFEHNNFQEYLASKYLLKKDFYTIQKLTSFKPEFKKIKPSWLNTISFLFSNLEVKSKLYNDLINWLLKIEPDILVRFEKHRIDIAIREDIFKTIFESYLTKQIYIRNEKFESEDLANFVSDSDIILQYVIKKLETELIEIKFVESIRLLKYFDGKKNYTSKIESIILRTLKNQDASKKLKYYCLSELTNLEIFNVKIVEEIIGLLDLNQNSYFRAGIYKYLLASNYCEAYCEIFISGLKLSGKMMLSGVSNSDNDVYFGDEEYNLKAGLNKINSVENVKKVLKWISNLEHIYKPLYLEIARSFIQKSESIYNSNDKTIFNSIYELFLASGRTFQLELKTELIAFFKNTNSRNRVFKKAYSEFIKNKNKNQYKNGFILSIVTESKNVNFLIAEIKSGKLSDESIFILRNTIHSYSKKNVFDDFYSFIEIYKNGKYKYAPQLDYDLKRQSKKQKDLNLLVSRDKFKLEIEKIFKLENKECLTNDELWDFQKEHFNDDIIDNNVVIELLRNRSREFGIVRKMDILTLLENDDAWNWIVIHQFVNIDTGDNNFEFKSAQENWIKKWVNSNLKNVNFLSAIQQNSAGNYNYRFLELYIPYFVVRLNLPIPEQILLSFLYVDSDFIPQKSRDEDFQEEEDGSLTFISDYIKKNVGIEKVKNRILKNLEAQILTPIVEYRHYLLCEKYEIFGIDGLLLKSIFSKKHSNSKTERLIAFYIKLGENLTGFEDRFHELPQELKIYSLKLLSENYGNKYENYCFDAFNNESDSNNQYSYLAILLKMDISKYFYLFKKWIIDNKTLPDRTLSFSELNQSNLNDLIEIYDFVIKNNIGNDFWHDRAEYLSRIIELGSLNKDSYKIVREVIEIWIKANQNYNFLYYSIQRLDQMYYSKIQQSMTIDEVISLIQ